MYKVFKLSNAEVKKIYSRPSVLLVFLFLAIVVFFSSTLFSPKQNIIKESYLSKGPTVQKMFDTFKQEKINDIDDSNILINSAEEKINNLINIEDKLQIFRQEKLIPCYNYFIILQNAIEDLIENNNLDNEITVQNAFRELKTKKISDVENYIRNDLNSNTNFYITENQYNTLKTFFNNFYRDTPDNFNNYQTQDYVNRYNILVENYFNFEEKVFTITNSFEKFNINQTTLNNLKTEYIDKTNLKLQTKYNIIENYYVSYADKTDISYRETMDTYLSEYCSIAKTAYEIVHSELELLKAGNKSDTYLQNCIGFENFRRYELQEDLNINKYLIENNLFEYNILRNFSFNNQSGYKVNMLDFSFFALQICSIILILFLIFSISAIIADEQNKGTIKLVAIRPITRNKILSGKYLGAIKSSVIALIITTVGTLIFGYINYGLPTTTTAIISINSGVAMGINIYLLFAIYILNIIINFIFFASISMFLACSTKSNVITIFVSSIIYFLSIGMVNFFNSNAWSKYLPIANIDLFKYFGNNSTGFLSMNLSPDPSLIFSSILLILSIIILNSISHMLFSSRDLA